MGLWQPPGLIVGTTVLVRVGAFRYIRHPLYCLLLCRGVGAMLKSITPVTITLMVINTLALVATARVEADGPFPQRLCQDYIALS